MKNKNCENEIRDCLSREASHIKIISVEQTGSTNDVLKSIAVSNKEKESILYIAQTQTHGRGRKGRSFFSPENTGIYMSLLLYPDFGAEDCTLITPMCAVAVCEAIETVTGRKTGIKWVNDIFSDNKKVAGILTEGAFSDGKADYIIVGTGINLALPEQGFPKELENIAGSLTEADTDLKNRLIAETVNRFMYYYNSLPEKKFVAEYKKRLFFLGDRITVISADGNYEAVAADTDEMCRLEIIKPDGSRTFLASGEISIRI